MDKCSYMVPVYDGKNGIRCLFSELTDKTLPNHCPRKEDSNYVIESICTADINENVIDVEKTKL